MIQLTALLTLLLLLSVESVASSMITAVDFEHELLADIAGRFRLAARQLRDNQSILPFDLQFPIHDILRIDAASSRCRIRASIRFEYQLDFLRWDLNDTRSRYYNIDEIILNNSTLQSLWLPDMDYVDDDAVSFDLEHESAKITYNGVMTWTRRGLFTIVSPIDLNYYPFDHHYVRVRMRSRQTRFQLQYEKKRFYPIMDSRLSSLWTRLFQRKDAQSTIGGNSSSDSSTAPPQARAHQPLLSHGWFGQILDIESEHQNGSLDNLTIVLFVQRRREAHISTTVLPTLFLSIFVVIYYFSSIETHQRLLVGVVHVLITLTFLIYLDRKIDGEHLAASPLLIKYLAVLFIVQMLSLFFDHIIHSVYYGGVHFISNWIRPSNEYEMSSARLASFSSGFHGNHIDPDRADLLVKQFVEHDEFSKIEDHQRRQWHKQARLSECLCCWFFLTVITTVFISIFFIFPTLG